MKNVLVAFSRAEAALDVDTLRRALSFSYEEKDRSLADVERELSACGYVSRYGGKDKLSAEYLPLIAFLDSVLLQKEAGPGLMVHDFARPDETQDDVYNPTHETVHYKPEDQILASVVLALQMERTS